MEMVSETEIGREIKIAGRRERKRKKDVPLM
jgi:hypothetical protein